MTGPLNQCEHPNMYECCPPKGNRPGCGHWHCDDCGLFWDDWAEGGPEQIEATQVELAQEMRDYGGSSECNVSYS